MGDHGDDPFARLEKAAEALERRASWEQRNRIGLLRVHAGLGIITGIQLLLFGGAATIENLIGLWTRLALGVLGLAGGTLLAVGLLQRPRSIRFEALGLVLLAVWDGSMAVGFAFARIKAGDFAVRALTEPLPKPPIAYVAPYVITVYAGLCALVVVHLLTLRHKRKVEGR